MVNWTEITISLILVFNISCASTSNTGTAENIKYREPIKEYKLIDFNGILHMYKDDLNNVVFPRHNRLLTQYCREHKCWEDIQARWSQDKLAEPGNYRYNYFVMENK